MNSEQKLVNGLQEVLAYAKGEKTAGRTTVVVPKDVDVKSIRVRLHLSQQEFAMRYGFPVATVRNWEQRRRRPEGAARLLLRIIEAKPEAVEEVLHAENSAAA